jgi:hypothetical protein
MCDDSFDLGEIESYATQTTVTAWSAQVAPKVRGSRTYSRRGITGVLPEQQQASSMNFHPRTIEDPPECFSPGEETFDQSPPWEESSLPSFTRDTSRIPGRRRFTRANSISAISHHLPQPAGPLLLRSQSISDRPPPAGPLLLRSQSVSDRSPPLVSMSSSSLSSSNASIPQISEENVHPNFDPLEENASPKRGAEPLSHRRGRKKVRSARSLRATDIAPIKSLPLSGSFSNLARHGGDGLSWAKLPPVPSDMSPFPTKSPSVQHLDSTDLVESSPAGMSIGSNRKRGIFESPFDDCDDCSPRPSHSRSRSRKLSSPTTRITEFSLNSADKLPDFPLHSKETKNQREMDIASDDGDSGPERDGGDSGDDASVESVGNKRSPMPTFVPYEQRQNMSFSSVATFSDALMETYALQPESADVDDVISSMSSYPDLRFLTKSLRREREGSRVSWNLALPIAWDASRRTSFIQWTTRSLGFTLRAAGGSVTFFQISKSKGAGILKLLESTVSACKERGIGVKSPTNAIVNDNQFTFVGVQGLGQPASATKTLAMTPKEYDQVASLICCTLFTILTFYSSILFSD